MKSKEVLRLLNVSRATLTNLVKASKIRVLTLPNGYYDYNAEDVYNYLGRNKNKLNIAYIRVSNSNAQDFVKHQKETIEKFCFDNEIQLDHIFEDICPGVDFDNRNQLFKMLDLVMDNQVSKVLVLTPDRIGKNCYSLFKQLFAKQGTEIVALKESINWQLEKSEMISEMSFLLSTFSSWEGKVNSLTSDILPGKVKLG